MDQYQHILLNEFNSRQKVITELINLEAILNLPKGTELYISDIHGEFEAFDYILRTCAGSLREKINDCFEGILSENEKNKLTLLIAYPENNLEKEILFSFSDREWQKEIVCNLVTLLSFISTKYTRSKVRKALPEQYTYIIEELIYTNTNLTDNLMYFENILEYLISLKEGKNFILELSKTIRKLIVDHLHVIGDIYDRGAFGDKVMDTLVDYHSIDVQWGNHDIIWMGAFFGSKECLLNLLRIAAKYNYLYEIEKAYGLNLRSLFMFADKNYTENKKFSPIHNKKDGSINNEELIILGKVHQALTIMQFKMESTLINRRPEFLMDRNITLEKIDFQNLTVEINNQQIPLHNTCFNTVDINNPSQLTEDEERIINTLLNSFQNSLKLKKHISFLLKKGSMYKIYNNHLLFHGCIPLKESGEFQSLNIYDSTYFGKSLLDFFEFHIRKSSENKNIYDDLSTDLIWYCWNGSLSPLFGKEKMTTLERYFIKDKNTHIEKENFYYTYRNSEKICKMILEEFGLFSNQSRIINGHTPVKEIIGESPIRGNGLLFVIDGGLCEAYQKTTGIAGYSLINTSYGFQIVTHEPFNGIDYILKNRMDISSLKRVVNRVDERQRITNTTIGEALVQQRKQLLMLLYEFYSNV